MELSQVILAVALLVGCFALPTPEDDQDMSIFFVQANPGARIVGGTEAAAGSHPHMMALSTGVLIRSYLCGASIISTRTVVTAAHCIVAAFEPNSISSSLRGIVGSNHWWHDGMTYAFAKNLTHPSYVASTIKNDLGILITTANIVYNDRVRAIALNYDWVGEDVAVRVAGWGRLWWGGPFPDGLVELNSRTIDGERCVSDVAQVAADIVIFRVPHVDPRIEICTFHSRGHGNCHGDSGSALVRTDRGEQVGIVSWGLPCAQGAPDVFVRISAFRDWITANTV